MRAASRREPPATTRPPHPKGGQSFDRRKGVSFRPALTEGHSSRPRAADGYIARVIREPVRATPTSPAAPLLPYGIGLLLRPGQPNGRTAPTQAVPWTIASTTAASSCRLCLCHVRREVAHHE